MTKYFGIALLAAMLMNAGCSSDSSDTSPTSSVSISGSLSGTSSLASDGVTVKAITDYKVSCVTFTSPPIAGEGSVSAAGAFSLTMSGASPTDAFGCFVIYQTTVVASMVFEDAATSSMDGGNAQSSSYNGGGSALVLGAVVVDEDKGTAVVDTSNITGGDDTKVTGTFADMTGEWTLTCVTDATAGYACTDVPPSIYLNQFTVSDNLSKDRTGLSVWESTASFTGCGSTEDLDGVIPGTWTSTVFNGNFTFDPLTPANFTVAWVDGAGKTNCGFAATKGTTTCDTVVNTATWGNGTITYNDADCQAMCVGNSVWDSSGTCMQDYIVDWDKTRTAGAPGALACSGTTCGTGFVTPASTPGEPRDRFVINELIVRGDAASLFDEDTRTETICVGQDNTGCTNHTCTFTRFTKMSIKQSSATSAVIEVSFHGAIASSSPAACSQADQNNWILDEIAEERILFTATK